MNSNARCNHQMCIRFINLLKNNRDTIKKIIFSCKSHIYSLFKNNWTVITHFMVANSKKEQKILIHHLVLDWQINYFPCWKGTQLGAEKHFIEHLKKKKILPLIDWKRANERFLFLIVTVIQFTTYIWPLILWS